MPERRMFAFIDEAGQRSRNGKSSDHFVMSAVIIREEDLPKAAAFLADLRIALTRRPGDHLTWKNLKGHSPRLHAVTVFGQQEWATISTVVVAKRHISDNVLGMNDDRSYLFTLRFLLERLSWYARDHGRELTYTLAHVVRFKIEKLREYEAALRQLPDCNIAWGSLNVRGGRIDQPQRLELLQLADLAASATFAAFEPDSYGNTEPRYLQLLSDRLYRRGTAPVTSYGLKMHPWNGSSKAAYPWVAAL
ncbi:DUF3800 domain-containing protein [Nonomuraea angiospora]|uniref:DUF3800 domain-containing protein n=1 Tax=Nonomuraea angiospora TaxID=46172 RepID=UPI0029A5C065|nr:DUF3800 domain-containing protein [Nonomuraea angiospora]MDX3100431.1 DUF3800 domain-containing protein [Nonomuraea angiospora]